MSTKITAKQAAAAEATLKAYLAQKSPAKPKKQAKAKVWTDRKGRTFKQAQKAHRKARQVRFETSPLGGLTSVQRREIAAKLPYGYSQKQWEKAVAKAKAKGFR